MKVEATPPAAPRAFAYVRVSSDEEDGNNSSIAAQIQAIREYAALRGIAVAAVFEEPDVSGRKEIRREFDRMIDLAISDQQPVEFILTYSLSRFARRLLTQITAEHRLTKAGVALVTVLEGEAKDANSKVVRNIFAAMNEKYAVDASSFTRRDRRFNAQAGFWNGGPVPYGYRTIVATVEGRKERKKLIVEEEEVSIVRLIYRLALQGLDGQPMGTRAIAVYLNGQGFKIKGKPFRHSNVDGILTREHYAGRYFDRTCPEVDGKARPEHAIEVACPLIVEPEIAAAVMVRRAAAAPKVTPPRIVNSPVLLTGICHCGAIGCGAGLTIRTGKGGRYYYYTCNRRAEAAGACRCRPIRAEELDKIVVS
jgi:DNA invertase Pin-like site-specific DNA recombinase